MNHTDKLYDVAIVGGGLAGLSLAILLAKKNYSILLIEKKSYPYHKVCGEYISNESFNFLVRLGIPLNSMELPMISKVEITGINGELIAENMALGGFGISRFTLDNLLACQAKDCGVTVQENTLCHRYLKNDVYYDIVTSGGNFRSTILVGSFGRHSFGNFFKPKKDAVNWIGVKYHIKIDFPSDKIALHTFKNGYCGISKIDHDTYCLCYLAKASLLKKYGGNIDLMQQEVLSQNPFLEDLFTKATFLFDKPITVSNITFDVKKPVENHIFYVGDSAGAIAPLTGNGMSNAMRSAAMLSSILEDYLQKKISLDDLENSYSGLWNKEFASRIKKGRVLQYFFCNPILTSIFLRIIKSSKWIRMKMIRQSHGEPF